MAPEPAPYDALRRLVARTEAAPGAPVALGLAPIDRVLGGGLARGRLHELLAAGQADLAAAAGFAALLAQRLGGPLVWLRVARSGGQAGLHAPGLAGLGIDPGALILGLLPDGDCVLRAAADALAAGPAVVVLEPGGRARSDWLSLSRRLHLAAGRSGATALVLGLEADWPSSAATTRWRVRSLASRPLAAGAPGPPAFGLELLRNRLGGHGSWAVEWDEGARRLRLRDAAALPGAVVPEPADGTASPVARLRRAG